MAQSGLNQKYGLYFQRVNMLYQRPELKASLEIILSVFTVTMLAFFAIRPTITNIFGLQKKIEDQTILLKKADNKIAQLINAQKQLGDNLEELDLLSLAVPDSFDYFNYAKRLELVAIKNGVNLLALTFPGEVLSGEKNNPVLTKEDIKNFITSDRDGNLIVKSEITVTGGQTAIMSFLSEIENMDRLALVDSVKFSKTQKTASEIKQLLNMTADVYFYTLNKK